MRLSSVLAAAALVAVAVGVPAVAQLPQTRLGGVYPPGGQVGTTFEVRVSGEQDLDYEAAPKLLFSHPGITAEAVIDAATGAWQNSAFRVAVGPDVPPGRYEAMLSGFYGVSNPRAFRIESAKTTIEAQDSKPEAPTPLPFDEPFYGRIESAADVDVFTFTGEAGKTVVLRCEAAEIDSALQPVLEVVGPNRHHVGNSGGAFDRGATLAVTLPTAGQYTVRLADASYAGGADYAYRLVATMRPVVASAWPPAGVPGQAGMFDLYGYNLPGGQPVEGQAPLVHRAVELTPPADASGLPSSRALSPAQVAVDGFDYQFRDGETVADPVPVFFSPRPLLPEQEPNDDAAGGERVTVPAEVAGRFEKRGDADRFLFDAKKGEVFFLEAFAERYDSPADPVVSIDLAAGADGQPKQQRLTAADDQAENVAPNAFDTVTHDPLVRFEAPEDGTYRVTVRDRYFASRGGAELVYRLSVRRPEPDFRLAVVPFTPPSASAASAPWGVSLRKGESAAVTVYALRRDGYAGPITVKAEGLPPGLTTTGVTIPEGQPSAPLVLRAAEDAAAWQGALHIVGEANIPGPDGAPRAVRRAARAGTVVRGVLNQPTVARLAGLLEAAIVDEPLPFRVAGDGGAIKVAQGSQVVLPLRASRNAAMAGNEGLTTAIAVAAEGLPNDSKVKAEVKPFDPNVTEQLARLVIDPQAPPRSYAVSFKGTGKIDYAKFPHKLKKAKAAQETAAQRLTGSDEGSKQAAAMRDEAMKVAAASEAAKKAAEDQATAAKAEAERLKGEVAKADAALAEAKKVTESATEEAAKQAAAQTVAQRTSELDAARQQLAQAEQKQTDAAKQAADAATATETAKKAAAEREAMMKAAEEARKQAEAAKKAADQAAAEAEKAAAPQKLDYASPAPPVTITVVPAPAVLTAAVPDGGQVKRGATVEIKVTAKRQNGFEGPIRLELLLPPGAAGLTAEPVTIEAGQTEAVLKVTATGDAPEGDVKFPAIRATFGMPDGAPLDVPAAFKVVP